MRHTTLAALTALLMTTAAASAQQTAVTSVAGCTGAIEEEFSLFSPFFVFEPEADRCSDSTAAAQAQTQSLNSQINTLEAVTTQLINATVIGGAAAADAQNVGRFSKTSHSGMTGSFNPSFDLPVMDITEYSTFVAGQFAFSPNLIIKPFVGYERTEVTAGTSQALINAGNAQRTADTQTDNFLFGAAAIAIMDQTYFFGSVLGSTGETSYDLFAINETGKYDTNGVVARIGVGQVYTLSGGATGLKDDMGGTATKLNLEGSIGYAYNEGDAHTTTGAVGIQFGDIENEAADIALKAKLYQEIANADGSFSRPYVSLGVKHVFHEDNTLFIPAQTLSSLDGNGDGFVSNVTDTTIEFEDADTYGQVELGFDHIVGNLQFNAGTYYQGSEDASTWGGRFGVSIKFGSRQEPVESFK